MAIPKRIEYSVRALIALAVAEPATVNARVLARSQDIPSGYLYDVLADLRRVQLVSVLRGSHGGYALARPAAEITLGTVVRLLDPAGGPLAAGVDDNPSAARLRHLFEAANSAGLELLDEVTLADLTGP